MVQAMCLTVALLLTAGCVPLDDLPHEFCCDGLIDDSVDDAASRLEPGRPLRVSGPTEIPFQHSIAFSTCPQIVAQLALKNTGATDLLWSAFTPSIQLDVVPDSGLLLSGRSVPVIVSFNCTQPSDLLTFIEFAILDGDEILVVQRILVAGDVD